MASTKYIYSENRDEMIPERFHYKGSIYEWDEVDELYYDIFTDESYFMEIPDGAIF